MGFYRHEYWSRLSFPSPGDLPDPGIKPGSPALQADSLPSEPPGKPYFKGAERDKRQEKQHFGLAQAHDLGKVTAGSKQEFLVSPSL